jgi:hypothetical protein
MAVSHIKSTQITNADAVPRVRMTAGEGAAGALLIASAHILTVASAEQYSTYQMVRLPSNAVVKEIEAFSTTQGSGGNYDIGAYYPTGADAKAGIALDTDGTYGTTDILGVIDAAFFGDFTFDPDGQSAYNRSVPGYVIGILNATPVITTNTKWLYSHINKELWDALGLTTDPGGFIDIVLSCTDEASGATPGGIVLTVKYV